MIQLHRVTQGIAARGLVKLKHLNLGGAKKDRAASARVAAAEQSGEPRPGGTVVEDMSGNTGIGLARPPPSSVTG